MTYNATNADCQKHVVQPTLKPVTRIGELDGLRAFLAWWVVLAHILIFSGFRHETLPPGIRILAQGGYAVDVFIILSGFVITKLVAEKQETYRVFIVRRFMRLFPVFALTGLICILLRPVIWSIIAAHWVPSLSGHMFDAWESETDHFWAHVLVHAPMLQGAIPDNVLRYSAVAFLGPAWSTSLEWQYYLVAPLLVFIGRRFGPLGWFALVAGSIAVSFRFGLAMASLYPMGSFLPQKLLMFLMGGICYWMFVETGGKHRDLPWHLFFLVAPVVLWFTLSIPLAIWTAAFALILGSHDARGISKIKAFLNLPWLQRLGEISFSTYLVHCCCIWLVQACILRMAPQISSLGMLVGLLTISGPLILVSSEMLFRFIEKPGIQLGRRFTQAG
jgi:peptidoglycan/LPS O-acetylase OafA/YrhL